MLVNWKCYVHLELWLHTCRWMKTTEPRRRQVPPCLSTWSIRRICRKRIPLKNKCLHVDTEHMKNACKISNGTYSALLPYSRGCKDLPFRSHWEHNYWGDHHNQVCVNGELDFQYKYSMDSLNVITNIGTVGTIKTFLVCCHSVLRKD